MLKCTSVLSGAADKVVKVLAVLLLLVIVVVSSIQVFSRYVLSDSVSWTEECARYAFIWLSLCGATIATKKGSNATIVVLNALLKGKAKQVHLILVAVLVLLGSLLLTVQGVNMVLATTRQLSPAMRIPMCYVYGSVPVCGTVLVIHSLNEICQRIADLRGKKEEGGGESCQPS